MKRYLRAYRKEQVVILLQAFLFYVFPLFAGPTDMMGLVFLILLGTFVLGVVMGACSGVSLKYLYPLLVSVMFVPTVWIYYNDTAMIHATWYFVVSGAGLLLGLLIRVVVNWMDGNRSRLESSGVKRIGKIICVLAAVVGISTMLWLFGYHNVKRQDNIPSLTLIKTEGEAFGHKRLQGYHRDQLIEVWGEPTEAVHSMEDVWRVDDWTAVRVNYNNLGEVVMVGVIELGSS